MNPEDLVAPHVRALNPYMPTSPMEIMAQRLGLPLDQIAKLDANENQFPPSPRVLAALAATPPNLYPDPDQHALRGALSAFIGVPREHILCGAGGDEVIHLLFRMFITPGDAVIDCPPTFGVYRAETEQAMGRYVAVPRRADFSVDVEAVRAAVLAEPRARLLFITNPNNPDGSVISPADIRRLVDLPVIVVIDEAYIEMSAQPSAAPYVRERDNVIVVRTLSKLAGLAGMRVGYGLFPLALAAHAWKVKAYFTPSAPAQRAGVAVLEDRAYLDQMRREVVAERARLCEGLDELGWITPLPTETNFVLARISKPAPDGGPAGLWVKRALEQRGLLVRFFNMDPLRDCIRISIGIPAHTDRLIEALRAIGQV